MKGLNAQRNSVQSAPEGSSDNLFRIVCATRLQPQRHDRFTCRGFHEWSERWAVSVGRSAELAEAF